MLDSTQKKTEAKKKCKYGKTSQRLINNTVYGKAIENVKNRNDIKLVMNQKNLFKMVIKTKLYVKKNI